MNIKEFKDIVFDKAQKAGFKEFEIFYLNSANFSVNVFKAEIEKYQNNSACGASFRGLFNGRMGYSYSEKFDSKSAELMIAAALENAKIIDNDEKETIFAGSESYPELNLYFDSINALTVEDKINIAMELERTALDVDKRIKFSSENVFSNAEETTYIANSKGLELFQKENYVAAYVEANAEENNQIKTGSEIWIGEPSGLDAAKIARTAAKKALSYLGARTIKSMRINAVFENKTFARLMSSFVNNFYAENVQKSFSLLAGKIGKQIASEKLTIVDEPLLKNGYASSNFDWEGVASYNKTVVDKGQLVTYLYNLMSAAKDGAASTGNGYRASFKSVITTSSTNFYIKPVGISLEQMLKELGCGLYITNISGLHSGTNSVSGDFSVSAEGFWIENGAVLYPVEQIIVSGNFYTIIKNIVEIGNDLYFLSNGRGAPSIMVEGMDISGM